MRDDTREGIWLVVILGFLVAGAVGSVQLEVIAAGLVEQGVLVAGDDVMVPLGMGVGLDLVRVVICAAALLAVLSSAIFIGSARRRRSQEQR